MPKLPILKVEEKPDASTRPTHSIRVSDEEWAAWTAHAEAQGVSTSAWVRQACARETQRLVKGKK